MTISKECAGGRCGNNNTCLLARSVLAQSAMIEEGGY